MSIRKIILGLLAFVPIAYILLVVFSAGEVGVRYETFRWIHFSIVGLYLIGIVAYIREAYTNQNVPAEKRGLWAALLFLGGPIAQVFFFWHYVRGQH